MLNVSEPGAELSCSRMVPAQKLDLVTALVESNVRLCNGSSDADVRAQLRSMPSIKRHRLLRQAAVQISTERNLVPTHIRIPVRWLREVLLETPQSR